MHSIPKYQKLNKKIVDSLSDSRVPPYMLSMELTRENDLQTHQRFLSYALYYIRFMAELQYLPVELKEVNDICKDIWISLKELGLIGIDTNIDESKGTDYLVV